MNIRDIVKHLEIERDAASARVERIDAALRGLRLLEPGVAELADLQKRGGGGASMKRRAPAVEKKPMRRGRSVGKVLVPSDQPAGNETCGACGREGLQKSPGPGGYMRFHYSPCGLACHGANLANKSAEDLAGGTHSKKNCPKCKAA
jgi:hypothetical protein